MQHLNSFPRPNTSPSVRSHNDESARVVAQVTQGSQASCFTRLYDPGSPCANTYVREGLAGGGLFAATDCDGFPTNTFNSTLLAQCDTSTDAPESQLSVRMKKATCPRASRAARPNDPSSDATTRAYNIMYMTFQAMKSAGIERAPKETQAFKSFKQASMSVGKGAAVRTSQQYQSKMNHLASLKAKDVDANNTEPAFLLGGYTAPLAWDRLAEASIKSNAVNSSVSGLDARVQMSFHHQLIHFRLVCR